jgi:hypothetical protein
VHTTTRLKSGILHDFQADHSLHGVESVQGAHTPVGSRRLCGVGDRQDSGGSMAICGEAIHWCA